ncbi:hypothetical protein D3C84_978700 [compost metagenome]
MATVDIRRHTCLREDATKHWDQTIGIDAPISKVAPAIDLPEDRAMSNAGHSDPIDVSLNWTQFLEGRGVERRPPVLSITFRVRQIERNAGTGLRLSMLDLESCQFVTPKPPPESDQHQGNVASTFHHALKVTPLSRKIRFAFKPAHCHL